MIAISKNKPEVVLGETTFNIARFADKTRQRLVLPIREGFFQLTRLVSVLSLESAADIGIDVGKVIEAEDPNRQKKIHPDVLSSIKANAEKQKLEKKKQEKLFEKKEEEEKPMT